MAARPLIWFGVTPPKTKTIVLGAGGSRQRVDVDLGDSAAWFPDEVRALAVAIASSP